MGSSPKDSSQQNSSRSPRLSLKRSSELESMGLNPEESLEFAIIKIPKITLVTLLNNYGYQAITPRREQTRDDPESVEP